MTAKITVAVLLALLAFVAWRLTSVSRGGSKRDEELLKLLDPVGQRLERREPVEPEEISQLTRRPELRNFAFHMLSAFDRLDLFPPEHLSKASQAEGTLVYWLRHPNELQDSPVEIELIETIEHPYGRRSAEFFVFKYRMPEGHWAGTAWLLGLAGPFFADEEPYESVAGGFSRAGDREGGVTPLELVTWYAEMHFKKFSRGV